MRLAAGHGNRALVEALLKQGGDPRLKTSYGMSAIDVARELGRTEIVELLEAR